MWQSAKYCCILLLQEKLFAGDFKLSVLPIAAVATQLAYILNFSIVA